ncbi:MAG TPA: glycosyl hydrolase, partial [Myxococcota bacterium]|nr:glycosyl hydrolase [Myxococcota bacterium]
AVEWVLDVLGPPDERVRRVGVLAGRVGPERDGIPTLSDLREIGSHVQPDGHLRWDVPEGRWRVFALYTNSTGHFVMGGAFPGEERDALVVDHLSRRGADTLIEGYAEPVLADLAPGQLDAVFIDSFELMGELPFTHDFLEEFETRAGYDLRPHLPLVFRRGGESKYGEMMDLFGRTGGPLYASPEPGRSERIREDYEAVRQALFEERFVGRFAEWARSRDLELRLQAHGGFGDILDTYALADVPESEALFAQGSFDFLKLAASAAHVADRRWASSESFIRLRLLGTRLDEQELRLLAGRAYSAGINRLVYHGVPYPYRRADGRVWFPFSGGFGRILAGPLPMSFHVDEAQLARLPEFNRLLARLSVAMSHGEPVADVAWLHADPSYPDTASLDLGRVDARVGESDATRALRARGLVHDRISRRMLDSARLIGDRREADGIAAGGMDASIGQKLGVQIGARSYRALLLDPLAVAEPVLVTRLAELAEAGIPILTLGALPERAPGLRDAIGRDARVRSTSRRLASRAHPASDAAALETLLARYVPADLVEPMPDGRLAVSLERRRSREGEILLVVNESWQATRDRLRFSRAGGELVAWDPATGRHETLRAEIAAGDTLVLELGPAECRILTLEAPGESPR